MPQQISLNSQGRRGSKAQVRRKSIAEREPAKLIKPSMSDTATIVRSRKSGTLGFDELLSLIERVCAIGGSDFHVHPTRQVRVLCEGRMRLDELHGVTESEIRGWLDESLEGTLIANQDDPFSPQGHRHVAVMTANGIRARLAFRMDMDGVSVSGRIIPTDVPLPEEIGVPEIIQEESMKPNGMIIYVGATGSGKTWAISASIHARNRMNLGDHFYFLEDPIEFIHEPAPVNEVTQRQIGIHARSYKDGVEDALRSKPNVMMIGEQLDAATTRTALHASTTGHMVFTTSHAGNATQAIINLINRMDPIEQMQIRMQMAESLRAIVVQQLVPSIDGPLVPAQEILVNDINISAMIMDASDTHRIQQQLEGNDNPESRTMDQALLDLYQRGVIARDTALLRAANSRTLANMM